MPVFSEASDPVSVCGRRWRRRSDWDANVVILDTAGRLAIDAEVMAEVREISEVTQPHYTFLVIDTMTGHNTVSTAEAFHTALALDAVILTKLDGDARGGAALSVKEVVRPIAFASTGEKLKDFDLFHRTASPVASFALHPERDDTSSTRALHLPDRATHDEPAAVDDHDRLAQLLDHLHLVGREDERRAALAHLAERLFQERDVDRVEADERLVHDQDIGLVEDRRDQLDLLLVALRQFLGAPLLVLRDAGSGPASRARGRRPPCAGSPYSEAKKTSCSRTSRRG